MKTFTKALGTYLVLHCSVSFGSSCLKHFLPGSLFKLPNSAHVTRQFFADQIVDHNKSPSTSTMKKYEIYRIQDVARQIIEFKHNPRVALYPMSGTDSLTLLSIFPKAEVYLTVDINPMTGLPPKGSQLLNFDSSMELNPIWSHTDVENRRSDRLPRILSGIKHVFPYGKILSVTLFRTSTLTGIAIPGVSRGAEHTVIFFDAGDGTLRQYVHIQDSIPPSKESDPLTKSWWWQEFDLLEPSGVLIKAAVDQFVPEEERDYYLTRGLFRKSILDWLKAQSGVLVEDRTCKYRDVPSYALSGAKPIPGTVSAILDAWGGYGAQFQVVKFLPNTSSN